jgi:glycine/D-amino acid oxidase-like deaminating enzyme
MGKLLYLHKIFVPNLWYFGIYLRAMEVDALIIGQGICGTMLSWFLHKEGKTVLVIDDDAENTSSKAAAGVINPVTGRRYVTSWMADELLDFAQLTYNEFGNYLNVPLLYAKSIIDFFPSPQMRNAFVDRISVNDTYLNPFPDQNLFNPFFNYDFGCGEIKPAFTVHLQLLLSAWRKKLSEQNAIRKEKFTIENLVLKEEGIQYNDITAQKIVFCDGIAAANNPWFSLLPFSSNKGEALIIQCEDLNKEHIFKRGMLLVPLPEKDLFWFGSNYQWEFEDASPSEKFYNSATETLKQWLKKPFTVVDHKAAIRPATVERRPFVGFHPQAPFVGILNGMGTKGTSLAPFFAHQLAQHIVYHFPIAPEADVHRFQRILSR